MSIRELAEKIKQKIKIALLFPPTDLLIIAVIILVGFASFGLGRLSARDITKLPVVVTEEDSQTASVAQSSGEVVVSKNGTKYHFPWCSGAQRIAKQNLISFNSIQEAQNAGYTPAANCKGLK